MRRLLPWLVARLLLLVHTSLRTRRLGWARVERLKERGERYSFAVLHGRALLMLGELRNEDCTALVSRSEDGEIAAGVLRSLGYGVVRGSSSRGGASGLRALSREATNGAVPAITVDGPRGPAGHIAPGIAGLAKITGSWIVPISASCSAGFRLSSWDRTMVPRPGARNVLVFGRPEDGLPREASRQPLLGRRVREGLLDELVQHVGKAAGRLSPVQQDRERRVIRTPTS